MTLIYQLRGRGPVELFQEEGRVLYPTPEGLEQAPCMYFASCEQDAVTTVSNPAFGDVPACAKCAEFAAS